MPERPQNLLEVLAQGAGAGLGFVGRNIVPFRANQRAQAAQAKQQAETQRFKREQLAQTGALARLFETGRGERAEFLEGGRMSRSEADRLSREGIAGRRQTGLGLRLGRGFENQVKLAAFNAQLRNLRETTTRTDAEGDLLQGQIAPNLIDDLISGALGKQPSGRFGSAGATNIDPELAAELRRRGLSQ